MFFVARDGRMWSRRKCFVHVLILILQRNRNIRTLCPLTLLVIRYYCYYDRTHGLLSGRPRRGVHNVRNTLTWCDEQQHEQQHRGPQLPGLPHGLQLRGGRLTVHVGDGLSDGFGSIRRPFAVRSDHACKSPAVWECGGSSAGGWCERPETFFFRGETTVRRFFGFFFFTRQSHTRTRTRTHTSCVVRGAKSSRGLAKRGRPANRV